MLKFRNILLMFVVIAGFYSCTVSYSFTSATTGSFKSYTIYDFTDRMRKNPTLSDYLVEQMKDKFTRQTSLDYLDEGGELEFEGSIVGYDVKPIAIQTNDEAASNRLTITVKVKFTNNKDHDLDFDTEFSAYEDFSSDNNLSDVEDELVELIVVKIVDDIFNKSVANW